MNFNQVSKIVLVLGTAVIFGCETSGPANPGGGERDNGSSNQAIEVGEAVIVNDDETAHTLEAGEPVIVSDDGTGPANPGGGERDNGSSNQAIEVGETVIVIDDGTPLRNSGKVVATLASDQVLVVRKIEGDRLWVDAPKLSWIDREIFGDRLWTDEPKPGWIRREQVESVEFNLKIMSVIIRENPELVGFRGELFHQLQKPNLAILDLTHALNLKPRQSASYALRSDAWSQKGDYAAALADIEMALRIIPEEDKYLTLRDKYIKLLNDAPQK